MRSEKFHKKGERKTPIVVDEATRLTVQGTSAVHCFALDNDGKKAKLLHTGNGYKIKLHDIEEILLESDGDFNSIIEGPEKIDNTPIEVAVERPLTQTQQLRMWLQNEENMRNYAKQELSWDEFKDLGDLDDGDEFYSQFNQDMTKYEMQAEAIRQESSPLRGNPLSDQLDKQENNSDTQLQEAKENNGNTSQNSTSTDTKSNANSVADG